LVDAENAFNKLNRKVSLKSIKRLRPPLDTHFQNGYNTPGTLYTTTVFNILSQEGVTQGDMQQQWLCTLIST